MSQSEAVAVDQATPGSPAIDAKGQPVAYPYVRRMEFKSADDVRKFARFQALTGDVEGAKRTASIVGESDVKLTFQDQHPVLLGVMIGAGGAAITVGAVYGTRKFLAIRKAKKLAAALPTVTDQGKVLRIPAAR